MALQTGWIMAIYFESCVKYLNIIKLYSYLRRRELWVNNVKHYLIMSSPPRILQYRLADMNNI